MVVVVDVVLVVAVVVVVVVMVVVVAMMMATVNKMPCYRKDDRAMRPVYKLFHPNFVTLATTILCADSTPIPR